MFTKSTILIWHNFEPQYQYRTNMVSNISAVHISHKQKMERAVHQNPQK